MDPELVVLFINRCVLCKIETKLKGEEPGNSDSVIGVNGV